MRQYPHMCRDGHVEIGHADSGDDERCPACRGRDRADQAEALLAEADELIAYLFDRKSAQSSEFHRQHQEQAIARHRSRLSFRPATEGKADD